jgi:predicted metal-binding membrane protein
MMMAMMLPALTPALLRYRRAVRPVAASRTGPFTAIVAIAYFTVWTLAGVAVFPLGIVLAGWTMNAPALSRAVPFASGIILIAAGAAQFTAWKTRELRCCRGAPACAPDTARGAWQHGLRLGVHCVRCCAGLTSVLLISGVMDLRVMAIVTLAITAERVAPSGQCIARLIGTLAIAAGLTLLAQT